VLIRPKLSMGLSGGGFTPRSIPGLKLWLSGDRSQMYDDSAGTIPADFNDSSGKIDDLSGNGHHATQGTTANQPTLLANQSNGKPALDFNGTNNLLVVTDNAIFRTVPFMHVARFKMDEIPSIRGDNEYLFSDLGTSWYTRVALDDKFVFNVADSGSTLYHTSSDSTLVKDVWYNVYSILDSSFNTSLFIGATKQADTESPGSLKSTSGNFNIGAGNVTSNRFEGQMSVPALFYQGEPWIDDATALQSNINKLNPWLNR